MPIDTFHHGLTLAESQDGIRPIQTSAMHVIAIAGTAPNAKPAVSATLLTGNVTLKNALAHTAAAAGIAGNAISIRYVDPGAADQALAVTVADKAITVSLATDESGVITTTAAAAIAAIEGAAEAAALIGVANYSTSDGTGLLVATPALKLTGGLDEPFPINEPVLCTGRTQAAGLDTLGTGAGTLVDALDGIYDQTNAAVVVVRVAEGADDAATIVNLIGGVDVNGKYTGLHAFEGVRDKYGIPPRILAVPGFSSGAGVAAELISVAEKIAAVAILDGPDTTDEAAIAYANQFGSDRAYLIDPGVKVRIYDGTIASKPASPRAAGIVAKYDYWDSPSNRVINGIEGTTRAVGFDATSPTCRANILNAARVATIVNEGGYRLWGNRSLTLDPMYTFLSTRRFADAIGVSLLESHLWAVDRMLKRAYYDEICASVRHFIRRVKALGGCAGGDCVANPELNTPETRALGKAYFDVSVTPFYPGEHITFRLALTQDYAEALSI